MPNAGNDDHTGSFDSHHKLNISHETLNSSFNNSFTGNSGSDSVNNSVSENNLQPLPEYDSNTSYGVEMLLPVQGFYCRICDLFFYSQYDAYQQHCRQKQHYEMYKKNIEDFSGDKKESQTHRIENLPIKVKIENTDIRLDIPMEPVKRKPLSERLGSLKKHKNTKYLKQLKSQSEAFINFTDYNKSMRQYLPKPSSHITPSRKVYVNDDR